MYYIYKGNVYNDGAVVYDKGAYFAIADKDKALEQWRYLISYAWTHNVNAVYKVEQDNRHDSRDFVSLSRTFALWHGYKLDNGHWVWHETETYSLDELGAEAVNRALSDLQYYTDDYYLNEDEIYKIDNADFSWLDQELEDQELEELVEYSVW